MASTLDRLNSLPPDEAKQEFLQCCGSENWAWLMVERRPFKDLDELLKIADAVWWSVAPSDWLEAFRSHPKIGEQKPEQATSFQAQGWAEQEQAGTRTAAQDILSALAAGNRDYEFKFGYIFIVCATGKSSAEMLAILRERLNNDAERELPAAAEEQRKITHLRLQKLVQSLES